MNDLSLPTVGKIRDPLPRGAAGRATGALFAKAGTAAGR
jgi:hypothetical protein